MAHERARLLFLDQAWNGVPRPPARVIMPTAGYPEETTEAEVADANWAARAHAGQYVQRAVLGVYAILLLLLLLLLETGALNLRADGVLYV